MDSNIKGLIKLNDNYLRYGQKYCNENILCSFPYLFYKENILECQMIINSLIMDSDWQYISDYSFPNIGDKIIVYLMTDDFVFKYSVGEYHKEGYFIYVGSKNIDNYKLIKWCIYNENIHSTMDEVLKLRNCHESFKYFKIEED